MLSHALIVSGDEDWIVFSGEFGGLANRRGDLRPGVSAVRRPVPTRVCSREGAKPRREAIEFNSIGAWISLRRRNESGDNSPQFNGGTHAIERVGSVAAVSPIM